jgi:hypothetical protein
MESEPLLRQLAIVVGRALAKRWLRESDRVPPAQGASDRPEREISERGDVKEHKEQRVPPA